MARKPVLVQFDDELLARLDRVSEEKGRSRSAVVREAVERYVVKESVEEKDRRTIDGYTRIPDDGEFDAWAEASVREMIAEEPW